MAGRNYTHTGVWDQVLAFGQYQHATIDGEPVLTVFDASKCAAMLDDFAAHPENDIFYDKQHEIVDALGDKAMDRAEMKAWGDGHALAWANALCMVVGGKVVRYEAHPGAPQWPPSIEQIKQSDGTDRGDGVYAYRSEVTLRGADPKDGLLAFRYTSPYFVPEKDGWRLLNLTATNDPRMRGVSLAMERGRPIVFERMHNKKTGSRPAKVQTLRMERQMEDNKELMARAGCMESDSPAAQIEKMAGYIRKMEDAAAKGEEEKKELMSRVQKMESDFGDLAEKMAGMSPEQKQNYMIHLKTGNQHDGKGDGPAYSAGKDPSAARKSSRMESGDEEKTAMQAMQRRLDAQAAQIDALTSAIKAERTERESLSKQAMERKAREEKAEAAQWADAALRNGQWNPMHAGGKTENDPSKAVAMTRDWLEAKYLAGQKDILLPEGTFKPSEAQVMQRYTQGGSVPGSPDPREGAAPSPDERLDALISAEIRAAKAKGQTLSMQQAMGRVKASNPELHRAWAARPGRLA